MTDGIAKWLESLELGRYVEAFLINEIGVRDLPFLTEDDLVELGLPIGPRRRVMNAISNLGDAAPAPPEETEEPAGASGTTEAERRQLTVMFVDLVGSTELSGRLDPEDLRALMQRYQSTVADVIQANHGYLANWLGDGAIAYFGWPSAGEDQAVQAVRAGLAAVAAVGRLPLSVGATEMLAARVGIATGQVVVGDLEDGGIGPQGMVTGETPNLAARLQGLASPGGVVIGRTTRALVRGAFELDFLGPQVLKGFTAPIEAWSVRTEHVAESRFESPDARLTVFTGRTHEVGLLIDRWSQAKAGEGQVVLISGEPGIGKSRIVRAFRDRVDSDRYRRILYQCSPHHVNSALYPAIRQLELAAGMVVGEAPDAKLDRLEALLQQASPDVAKAAPLMAALLSIPSEGRYGALKISAQQQRVATLGALQNQLLGLARHEPVLFVLEDAHWIDPTTLELITTVVPRLADQPVLMLITHRPECQDPFQGQGHVTKLNLTRLSRAQVAAIVRDVAGKMVTDDVIARIVERTDGVPLFVEELTKAMAEANFNLADADVPVTLQGSLMARLDRLGPAKEIAQIGAVIGREFGCDLLARLVDRRVDLDSGLARLIDSQLIFRTRRVEGDIYTFKHALIQDIAYDSLLRQRRQALHLEIASTLAAGDPPTTAPEVLAHHFERGSDLRQALAWSDRASIDASGRSAQPEAVAHCSNALRILRLLGGADDDGEHELSLLLRLGHAQFGAVGGGAPEAIATFESAGALAARLQDSTAHVIALYGEYVGQMISGQTPRAEETARQVADIAQEIGVEWMDLVAARMTAAARFLLGNLAGADEALQRALGFNAETVSEVPPGFAHNPIVTMPSMRTHIDWAMGRREQALAGSNNAIETVARAGSDANSLAFALTWDILLGAFDRDGSRVQASATRLMEHTRRTGGVFWEQLSRWGLGTAEVLRGDGAAGLPLITAGIDGFFATGGRQHIPFMKLSHAEALYLNGDMNAALGVLEESRDLIERTEQRAYEPEMHRWRGIVLESLGRSEEAAAAYDTAIAVADCQESVTWRDRALKYRASLGAQN
ncbi:MAG: ATP-binding protein [Planctomycetota bacterium]